MDYYKMRRYAFRDVQTWINEDKDINYLEGALLRKYGLGYKALMGFLNRLQSEGKIEIDEGNIRRL